MDQLHYTTTERKKGQHLTFEERVIIQTRLKDGFSTPLPEKSVVLQRFIIC